MNKIFVDSDVMMDLLGKRQPFYSDAAMFFSMVDKGKYKAFVSPIIVANLNYILTRLKGRAEARNLLHKLKLLVKILPVDEKIIELALSSEFNDFEDAIQYYTARENGISLLLTRNIKDYKKADITIMTPGEFLKTVQVK